jgi:hypothetical protein
VEELFFTVLNVHKASDVKQMEIQTTEPLVAALSHLEAEIPIAKFTGGAYRLNDQAHYINN